MKKVLETLFVILVGLFFSASSFSATSTSGPYLVAEYGTVRFAGLVPPSGTEQEILSTTGVTGSYEVKDKGEYGAIGIGWNINRYFSVDVAYLSGVKLSTRTKVSGVNVGTIDIGGQTINVGNIPTDIEYRREAEASAVRLAVNARYPLNSWLDVTASVEAYQWKATVVNKVTVDSSGFYVGYNESDSGAAPALGLGVIFKPVKGVDVALQYRHMNKVTMPSLTLRYSL